MGIQNMILNVPPCSKPRMTQRDRWKKRQCVLDFFAFRDRIKQELKNKDALLIDEGPFNWDELEIIFLVPMPKSWSKKKKALMTGKPMQSRPDLDNYLKGLFDATHEEDSTIWKVTASKFWTDKAGQIIIN